MKLTTDQLGNLTDRYYSTRPSPGVQGGESISNGTSSEVASSSLADAAIEYAKRGIRVFPLHPGTKLPLFPRGHKYGHGCLDASNDPALVAEWWREHPTANIGVNTDGLLVFDLDLQHGADLEAPFPDTLTHYSGRGNGNRHLIYKPVGKRGTQLNQRNNLYPGVDLKTGPSAYIVAPPSIHPDTGKPYTVAKDHPVEPTEISDETLEAVDRYFHPNLPVKADGKILLTASGTTSKGVGLAQLLEHPPAEGNRNNWLTQVAGYYAREYAHDQSLFSIHVEKANQLLADPLPSAEVYTTIASIWETQHRNHPGDEPKEDNGFLTVINDRFYCQTGISRDGEIEYDTQEYADFYLEPVGVAVNEANERSYWVALHVRGKRVPLVIPGSQLGDDRAIRKFLAGYGATCNQPRTANPQIPLGVRLQRYLEYTNPGDVTITDQLGYYPHLGKFITVDGVIDTNGYTHMSTAGVMADPTIVTSNLATYWYGFDGTFEDAQKILREVQTYHDEATTAVFGAWWAACLIKPQLQQQVSIFPVMGVEAPSETGKTNGYFSLMVQLNGNLAGHVNPTKAVLRNMVSTNHNGIVWVDDLDDLTPYGDLIRAVTSNGSISKMASDNTETETHVAVNPLFITGEQLGFGAQKALRDRTVLLTPPSPTNRKSVVDPTRDQWEDIKELQAAHDGPKKLAVYAGWYQREAQRHAPAILDRLRVYKKRHQGRNGDKAAVLLAGADLMDLLLDTGKTYHNRVADWISRLPVDMVADNTLTTTVLPWALQTFDAPSRPRRETTGRFVGITTPVWLEDTGRTPNELSGESPVRVWVSIRLLSSAWDRDKGFRVVKRTESIEALTQQFERIVANPKTRSVAVEDSGHSVEFMELPSPYAELVLRRAGLR